MNLLPDMFYQWSTDDRSNRYTLTGYLIGRLHDLQSTVIDFQR